MSDNIDLTLLLRNLEARYWIEWWKIEDSLRLLPKEKAALMEKEILRLYRSGVSVNQIEKKTLLDSSTILRLLKRKGISVVSNWSVTQQKSSKVLELFSRGESVSKIAGDLKMNKDVVRKVLKSHGHNLESTKARSQRMEAEVLKLHGLGIKNHKIAETLKMCSKTTKRIIAKCQYQAN